MKLTRANLSMLSAALAIAIAAIAAGLIAGPATGSSTAAAAGGQGGRPPAAGLKPFRSCPALGRYARAHREALTPVFGSDVVGAGGGAPATGSPGAGAGAAGADSSAPSSSGPSATQTNIQEQGVDEPDIVKARGSTIFAIVNERLEATDGGAGGPRHLGSLELPTGPGAGPYSYGHQLLIVGDRALVLSTSNLDRPPYVRTVISEIAIADPAAMRAVRTLTFDGAYVSARQAGGIVRVVSSSTPVYPFIGAPGVAGGGQVEEGAPPTATPRARPAPRRVGRWLPQTRLHNHTTGKRKRGRLVRCGAISKPVQFSGIEMLSVLTIDLEQGLEPIDADSVMTTGEVVYASPQSLYVATERWFNPDDPDFSASQVSTQIHKFDATDPASTEYVGSGKVAGFMLSQWSMSEHEGLLRVASTTTPQFGPGGGQTQSESFVTVLGEANEKLVELGKVGGLGRGERIYAVRFIDEVGYVVTFRQVDPLYTVDLADPANPRVLGELKVPGYSAYLHPVGPGRLLGLGQDADSQGQTLGMQASLFDISDLTAPARLDSAGLGRYSFSEVEYDHHAFTFYEPERLVVIPLEQFNEKEQFSGATAFRIDPGGTIEDPVRLTHGDSVRSAIRRSLVLDGRLLTVSARGVMAHNLATLGSEGFAGFSGR